MQLMRKGVQKELAAEGYRSPVTAGVSNGSYQSPLTRENTKNMILKIENNDKS